MISVVIPVYNERESLEQLHAELSAVATALSHELEIILIDDGSTDGSWSVVQTLIGKDSRVRGIRFRRNFGKAAALAAGFETVRGDYVMTLDADLQDDPAEIPNFLVAMQQGPDVVSGWKKVRHDPWHKVLPSRVFNWMVGALTGVHLHDHNCGMKCYRAEVVREVRLYGELHRFVPVLAAARGFRVGEIVIGHRARKFGRSKYGFRRFVKGFLDLLTVKFVTGFGYRPQHALGTFGLVSCALGALGMAWLAATWCYRLHDPSAFAPLHQRPLLMYCVAFLLLGVQLVGMGFLAELFTAQNARHQDQYSIAERQPVEERR